MIIFYLIFFPSTNIKCLLCATQAHILALEIQRLIKLILQRTNSPTLNSLGETDKQTVMSECGSERNWSQVPKYLTHFKGHIT